MLDVMPATTLPVVGPVSPTNAAPRYNRVLSQRNNLNPPSGGGCLQESEKKLPCVRLAAAARPSITSPKLDEPLPSQHRGHHGLSEKTSQCCCMRFNTLNVHSGSTIGASKPPLRRAPLHAATGAATTYTRAGARGLSHGGQSSCIIRGAVCDNHERTGGDAPWPRACSKTCSSNPEPFLDFPLPLSPPPTWLVAGQRPPCVREASLRSL